MGRRLFCELGPTAYSISVHKQRMFRHLKEFLSGKRFSHTFSQEFLPVVIYRHQSLVRRQLGNVDMQLQENKAVNLSIAVPKVSNILIRPGETFSFWKLVGSLAPSKGYREGITISSGHVAPGVGGGMCQFTNLLHWMVLHSPLTITEHHHHNFLDLFPDYGRQIPFGTGTSIVYNYLDYQVKNETENTFQFIVELTKTHLKGQLRGDQPMEQTYHVFESDAYFEQVDGVWYRNNKVWRKTIDKRTGDTAEVELLLQNHARVCYDSTLIAKDRIKESTPYI